MGNETPPRGHEIAAKPSIIRNLGLCTQAGTCGAPVPQRYSSCCCTRKATQAACWLLAGFWHSRWIQAGRLRAETSAHIPAGTDATGAGGATGAGATTGGACSGARSSTTRTGATRGSDSRSLRAAAAEAAARLLARMAADAAATGADAAPAAEAAATDTTGVSAEDAATAGAGSTDSAAGADAADATGASGGAATTASGAAMAAVVPVGRQPSAAHHQATPPTTRATQASMAQRTSAGALPGREAGNGA